MLSPGMKNKDFFHGNILLFSMLALIALLAIKNPW